jgi:hypothetical protein
LFKGEETFEDTLRLPLRGVCKVHPDIHATRPAESRIQALNVVRRGKQETGNISESCMDFKMSERLLTGLLLPRRRQGCLKDHLDLM